MFTEAFHYTPADAAAMCAHFWLGNMGALVATGFVSDRLQRRKPFMIIGAIITSGMLIWWIPTFGAPLQRTTMTTFATLLGCCIGMTIVPWSAQYSETLEEISPALQATGWAFYGLVARGWGLISAPLSLTIAVRYGWAVWMKFTLVALVMFGVAMFFTHPSPAPSHPALPEPKPQPVSA
jgi:OPA family glycerol-3-phosphate transporter-like MFS transporter